MNLKRFTIFLAMSTAVMSSAQAALLHMEFDGGGNEIIMLPGATAQINIIWTMHATDTVKNRLTDIQARFNVNDVPNPDGTDRTDKYIVESISTPVAGWTTEGGVGVGGFFNESDFYMAAQDPGGHLGVVGNGTEFSTGVVSFVIRKTDFRIGDTYVTFRHMDSSDFLPFAAHGGRQWPLQWQTDIMGSFKFDMVLGNPGDAGPQWDPYHGYETFQPLIIHNLPEPATAVLVGIGCLGMVRRRRERVNAETQRPQRRKRRE